IAADALAILTVAVASIPLMRKLAFINSFWVVSIFLSVVTLHPIILTFVRPPRNEHKPGQISDRIYNGISNALIALGKGSWRWIVVGSFAVVMVFGVYFGHQLKTGDTSPGKALLFDNHPYNVAAQKVNDYVTLASPMIIIAEGKKPEAIKDAKTLNQIDLFQRHMEQGEGATS